MHLEYYGKNKFTIFVNATYFKEINWNDKTSIAENVKKLLLSLSDIYNIKLNGYYIMNVYVNKDIGTFIEVEEDDPFEFDFPSIDLKITIYLKKPFYLGVEDYFLLPDSLKIYYYKNMFFVNINSLPNTLLLLEMGKIIYGEEVDKVVKKGILINKKR